ncbi:MAG TPA: winged helix-turn-helix domain-containing protein, partial [Pyrinomonadaceae bacterium]|nr:winged helix-turn-helix domain-containing protein [Pyrinomonadaceae bacterium]
MLIYRFRNCLLNTVERSVIKGDQHVELTTKTFDVLLYLIQNAGKVVTKDELLGAVWGGNFVEESNLPVHISKLRRSLGDVRGERYIETVQGVGYRFTAPVSRVGPELWERGLKRSAKTPGVVLGTVFDSIAILPLENLNGSKETEYLAEGLTESLINKLSVTSNLRVIARNTAFRYKGENIDVGEVGGVLGVGAILTGRARIIGNEVAIGVELVRVQDGSQLWGEHFHREFSDIIRIQEEITTAISKTLCDQLDVSQGKIQYPGTSDPSSYKAYLMGIHLLGKRTEACVHKAIKCFAESASHDAENMLAYVKTVEAYQFLYIIDSISHDEVIATIQPFLSILTQSKQANDAIHSLYGTLSLHLYWNFEVAEDHLRKALMLNPNRVETLSRLAEVLVCTGRGDEAKEQIGRILHMDPFSLPTYNRIARLLYLSSSYDEALCYLSDAMDLEPYDYETLALRGSVLTELRKYDAALQLFRQSLEIHESVDV